MSECSAVTERMPLLLTESLNADGRERAHQHIESCDVCGAEWSAYKETWLLMGDLPEVEVPARVKARFLVAAGLAQQDEHRSGNVVPFRRRPVVKWVAQAAAVAVLVGSAYFVGDRNADRIQPTPTIVSEGMPFNNASTPFTPASLDQTRTLNAEAMPVIANALAKVLRDDTHEGVRIRAVETLATLPPSAATQTRDALIEALKNDPNPAVRLKAVEALIEIARSGEVLDKAMVDTLREKAAQDDENLYVRVKAAEALSQIKPRS